MKRKLFRNLSRLIKPICLFSLLAITTSGWAQSEVAEVHASDAAAGDQFGRASSISGDTAVVGSQFDDHSDLTNAGSAYIYQRDYDGCANCCTDCWGEVAILRPTGLFNGSQFGASVSISGDTAIVGAPGLNIGKVYIFYRDNDGLDAWGLETTITTIDINSSFATSVSIQGDLMIVGAPSYNASSGRAHIYGRNQGGADNWGKIVTMDASDGASGDLFGWSVAINGSDHAIVGAPLDFTGSATTGSAYIYRTAESPAPAWEECEKITDSHGAANDTFGWSVSISG